MERHSANASGSGRGSDGEAAEAMMERQSGNASGRGNDGEADGAVQAAVAAMERQTGAVPDTVARGRPVPQRPGRSPHAHRVTGWVRIHHSAE
jgi:hypothetical protein